VHPGEPDRRAQVARPLGNPKAAERCIARDFNIVATYDYCGEDGELLFQVCRLDPKSFRQRRPDGNGGWIWSVKDVEKVPYRLPELAEAIALDRVIFIPEGEKDVENLVKISIPATCNAGGAEKWQPELNEHFRGADVIIIPDNDEPGGRHLHDVARKLQGIATRIRVLELPGDGKDVSDWIQSGGTPEGLHQLAEAAPVWQPIADAEKSQSTGDILWHGQFEETEPLWLVKNLLPEVGTALLSGQWGMFKSFALLDLGASLITGAPFAGRRIMRQGGVLVFAVEGASTFPIRLDGLVHSGKLPKEPQPFAWQAACPSLLAPGALAEMERVARAVEQEMKQRWGVPLVLIAVDTLVSAANFKDESSAAEGQAALNVLNDLAKTMKACVLAVDHFGKVVETGTRGSSAKEGAVDAVLALLGERTLSGSVSNSRLAVRKLRAGQSGDEISFTASVIELGTDRDGDPVTTRVIEWELKDKSAAKQKDESGRKKRWGRTLQTLRRALMVVLAERGQVIRPFGMEGPAVRAVDRESLRTEFYKIVIVDSATTAQQNEAKKKAFNRSLKEAVLNELIGVREVGDQTMIWFAMPEDAAIPTPGAA
jgi:hypothetical protein